MKATRTDLPGLLLLEPVVHGDSRGFFLESYNRLRHEEAGVRVTFVQDNHSRSQKGVLRGLHFQRRQGKLVRVVRGEIFDVAVDIRPDSPTFGRWHGTVLSDTDHRQFYIPPGFAHGFCVLSEMADVLYKTTEYYRPEEEAGIRWDDPAIGIEWPVAEPILSERDSVNPLLRDVPREKLLASTGE
jgi:dTDP-4-dehydrorhamnose 3,5-epimerase